MPNVHITIDDREVSVPANSTVLDAAKVANIDIPTLCAHPAIEPIGACRMCLVEVEKQRVLQPACTFPVSEGMVIHTKTEKVLEARRFVLQLLFSERNHFCMFCQMSGSCELQDLAYESGLDHWEFDRAFPKLPVDASRKFFVMDHNRCILCRRCIRVCDELVGNNTLGLKGRGADTMIIADMDVPFGESSCVSCGTCLQVCPTGALMDRASAYMGSAEEITRVKSRCMACSVGCGVELIIRDNRVIRVEGDWDAEPNHGLLCEAGRFSLMHDKRHRVRKPLVKGADGLSEVDWEQALGQVAAKFQDAGDDLCSIVSGYVTTEAAEALEGIPGKKTLLGGVSPDAALEPLSVLDAADVYIVVGTDLTVDYQVAGFAIKRSTRHRGARLLLLDEGENGLAPWAYAKWSPEEADEAVKIALGAEMPVIVYDTCGADLAMALAEKLPKSKLVSFAPGGNALGIKAVGVTTAFEGQKASVYYVLADEMAVVDGDLLDTLKKADFVVVQSCFREPWDEIADVILPTPTWHEKSGTMTNVEGVTGQIVAGVVTKLPSEAKTIEQLGALVR